jgi:hypothetical protein
VTDRSSRERSRIRRILRLSRFRAALVLSSSSNRRRIERAVLRVAAVVTTLLAIFAIAPHWSLRTAGALLSQLGEHWLAVILVAAAATLWFLSTVRRRAGSDDQANRRSGPRLPLALHVGWLLITAAALGIGVGYMLWKGFGSPAIGGTSAAISSPPAVSRPPSWTPQNSLDTLKVVLAVVGGIGGVVALTVAYRRQRLNEAVTYREETKLYAERFAKSAELLGDDDAAVRLAGVYAISALADDWKEGRQTCIDVLCAYLRMSKGPRPAPASEDDVRPGLRGVVDSARRRLRKVRLSVAAADELVPDDPTSPAGREREVRHTIIRIIRDHLNSSAAESWSGHQFDFTGAIFDDGGSFQNVRVTQGTELDFSEAVFIGHTSFIGMRLEGGTVFFGYITLTPGSQLLFFHSKITGGWISFSGSRLDCGQLAFDGTTVTGGSIAFPGARLTGTDVDMTELTLDGDGELSFEDAELTAGSVNFPDALLRGGTIGLTRAVLKEDALDLSRAREFDPDLFRGDTTGVRLPTAP